MKTIKLTLLGIMVVLAASLRAQTTQSEYWFLGSYQFNFTSTAQQLPTHNGQGPTNGVYDENGDIVFYINGVNNIYNKNGIVIGQINASTLFRNFEHLIVPFFGNDKCSNPKYFVYSYDPFQQLNGGDINVGVIEFNRSTGLATYSGLLKNEFNNDITVASVFGNSVSMAASKEYNRYRHIYVAGYNSIFKVKLTDKYSQQYNYGYESPEQLSISLTTSGYPMELEISADGTKLAWISSNDSENDRVFVCDLDNNGNYVTNSLKSFNTGFDTYLTGKGLEFNANGTKLYYSTGGTSTGHGVFVIDLTQQNPSPSLISSTQAYGNSQIELGFDGLLYVASNSDIIQINPLNNSLGNTFGYQAASLPIFGGYGLPDQIDGEVYANRFVPETQTYDVTNYNVTNSTTTWDENNNPINTTSGGVLRIKNSLNFGGGANITIENMTLEFGEDAWMNIMDGAKVKLENCTLRIAGECNKMWNGIYIQGGQNIDSELENNNLGFGSIIRDAKRAIYAYGSKAIINIHERVNFIANESDIYLEITDGNKITVNNCSFNGEEILRDQNKGDANGYTDGYKRSKRAIEIYYGANLHQIILTNQTSGYQEAVYITASDFKLEDFSSSNAKKVGLFADAKRQNKIATLDVYEINSSRAGVTLRNGYDANVYRSHFEDIYGGFALDWRHNYGRAINIGDVLDPDKKNTFKLCNWSAVNLYDNLNFIPEGGGSSINIHHNDFNTQPYAKGIAIQEISLGTNASHDKLLISHNDIDVGRGIELINVFGKYPNDPLARDYYNNNALLINHTITDNQIHFKIDFNPQSYGIAAKGSGGFGIVSNNIQSNVPTAWQNSGVEIKDGPNTLVLSNFASAGSGLLAMSNMLGSNYYCNTMYQCVNGIKLAKAHILRGDYQTHGILNVDSRHNTIGSTWGWGSDMMVGTVEQNCKNNQWVFLPAIPFISYPYGCGSINAGTATNSFCETNSEQMTSDTNAVSVTNIPVVLEWKVNYYNERMFRNEYFTSGTSDNNVKKLMDIEDMMALQQFEDAREELDNWNINDDIINDYKTVYSLALKKHLDLGDTLALDSEDVVTLRTIAHKDPIYTSPAAYAARAMLWDETFEEVTDTLPEQLLNISGYAGMYCHDTLEGISIWIEDQANNIICSTTTDVNGKFIFEGSMLASLTDTNTLYSLRAQLPDQSIRSTSLKSIHNLAMGSSYHMACALSKRNAAGTEPEQTLLTEFDVNSITIYPNPAYHQLHISAPAHYTTVELYDLIGNRVYFGSANSIISTSQLSNGIYLIKLHATDQSVVTQKVVIQHD